MVWQGALALNDDCVAFVAQECGTVRLRWFEKSGWAWQDLLLLFVVLRGLWEKPKILPMTKEDTESRPTNVPVPG